jgi:hypothetical protein
MLLGITYAEAVAMVGRERPRGTTAADLIPHLRAAGYTCPDRLAPGWPSPPPELALVRVAMRRDKRGRIDRSHWMVYRKPLFYDPARSCYATGVAPLKRRVTSYLPLERCR